LYGQILKISSDGSALEMVKIFIVYISSTGIKGNCFMEHLVTTEKKMKMFHGTSDYNREKNSMEHLVTTGIK
jgi:hypothetical protein